jgi:hypothetical protein
MVAALLGFVASGLGFGSTLQDMEAVAFNELERARRSAERHRRQALRRSQLNLVEARQQNEFRSVARGRSSFALDEGWSLQQRDNQETNSLRRCRTKIGCFGNEGADEWTPDPDALISRHRRACTANPPIRLFQNVGICRLFSSEEAEHHERCAT